MKREATKIVPKFFNFEKKQSSMDCDQEKLTMFNNNPDLLKNTITCVYDYDIETKVKLSQ